MSAFHVIALIQERYSHFFFCHSPDASGFGLRLVENHSLKKDAGQASMTDMSGLEGQYNMTVFRIFLL